MLSPSELSDLRAVALSAMPDSCQIQRYTSSPDGFGGTTEPIWSTLQTVPCRISENKQAREFEIGGSIKSINTHVVRLPYGVNVTEADRLVVTSAGRTRTLEITRLYESSYATSTSVGCTEIRGEA